MSNSLPTKAEQRILGFLVAAGGDSKQGSTVNDIMEGTGLGRNTVYVALRNKIPGVMKCLYHTNNGSSMYYVTAESIRDSLPPQYKEVKVAAQQTIMDSKEWHEVPDIVFGTVDFLLKEREHSIDGINSIIETAQKITPDDENFFGKWAACMQAAAIIALEKMK